MKFYTEFHRDQPGEIEDAIEIIQRCTPDINRLMTAKQLVLNEGKTEAIVLCAPRSNIPPISDTINMWGVLYITPSHLFDTYACSWTAYFVCLRKSFTCIKVRISDYIFFYKIRKCLNHQYGKMIIHGLVTSMIDYGNAVVFRVNVHV